MKWMILILVFCFSAMAFGCANELAFVKSSVQNPRSTIGLELKPYRLVSIENMSTPEHCVFRLISEFETDEGDLAMCFTQVLVTPTSQSNFQVEFLSPDRTLCFL